MKLENQVFCLEVGEDALVRSLTVKKTGRECLAPEERLPLVTVTQERPFNNEVKLAHPNKRTTYPANGLRREGDRLIVSFDTAPYRVVIRVTEAPRYLQFELEDFLVGPKDYEGLVMAAPPVAELRLLQLPVTKQTCFGEWLNVSWDEEAAVCVLAADPYAHIDAEEHRDEQGQISWRTMSADLIKGIKLKGGKAALIAGETGDFLDAVAELEEDNGLPKGVASRRSGKINRSIYFTHDLCPANADRHIARAKQGGFRLMQVYYTAMCKEEGGYSFCGDYDYNDNYPKGEEDLKAVIAKIKAAGITPGLHVLQTHIGLKSRYVTPRADRRLRLTDWFTLGSSVGKDDTVITVDQNPEGCERTDRRRILRFGEELIAYEGYTTERPYQFTGCTRGALNTLVTDHPLGEAGGVLDISEFGATSCYIDQRTDLQDEVAEKIAAIYNCGFEFMYMDGSEGTNIPYDHYVALAQMRVLTRLKKEPLFVEGAAKSHFGWHYMSAGNAFDIFPPSIFKEKLREFPAREAPLMQQDFTSVNFGWWGFWDPETQADMYEYGTSLAAAWDCPVAIQSSLEKFAHHPRIDDILEVMRRWEEVRVQNWLTPEQKEAIRDPHREYHLMESENGIGELVEIREIPCGAPEVSCRLFEQSGQWKVLYWHKTGEGTLRLADGTLLTAGARQYYGNGQSREELLADFAGAALV